MTRALVVLVCVLLSACAARVQAPANACSDPLALYTNMAFRPCCVAHDEAYGKGGQEPERLAADRALYVCIRDLGYEHDAGSMFMAVRWFGASRFTWR